MKNILAAIAAVLTLTFAAGAFATEAPITVPVQGQATSAKKVVKKAKAVKKHKKAKKAKKPVFGNHSGVKKAAPKK